MLDGRSSDLHRCATSPAKRTDNRKFVDVTELVDKQDTFAHVATVDQALAGDAGESARRERRGEPLVAQAVEQVRAACLGDLTVFIAEQDIV